MAKLINLYLLMSTIKMFAIMELNLFKWGHLLQTKSYHVQHLGRGGEAGFFCKFLMGRTQNFWSPVGPRWGLSRMGGGDLQKNPNEAKTAHLVQN